jgi:aerobic-type carbon monoxide dehydrogenase small subunit (CoxS/CutS family)
MPDGGVFAERCRQAGDEHLIPHSFGGPRFEAVRWACIAYRIANIVTDGRNRMERTVRETTEGAPVHGPDKAAIVLKVNDADYPVWIEPRQTLLDVLRNELGLTGTKRVCDNGECGACTVIIDGKTVYACLTLAVECEGRKILTIEGLAESRKLHPIQQAFIEEDGFQCGFCTPGQILSVKALLDENPDPTAEQIKRGVSGNLCRCGAYPKIFKAADRAVRYLRARKR